VSLDKESGQTIISGMGELHLEIYVERMRREYKVRWLAGGVDRGRLGVCYCPGCLAGGRAAGQAARTSSRVLKGTL
jgi:hypothetical protein